MKKVFIIAAIIITIIVIVASFALGRADGIRHAIEDSEMCIVEFGDPDVEQQGYDLRIWIDLDGQSYEHFAFIG